MGTSCVTTIFDEHNNKICCLRSNADGQTHAHGQELADFLSNRKLCRGIQSCDIFNKNFNGANCLAAQLVSTFKTKIGTFYLFSPATEFLGINYFYSILTNKGDFPVIRVKNGDGKFMFECKAKDYKKTEQKFWDDCEQ